MKVVFLVVQDEDEALGPVDVIERLQMGLVDVLAEGEGVEAEVCLALAVDGEVSERVEHAARLGGLTLERVRA